MARYEDDYFRENFSGFPPPRRGDARGMDPNFRGGGYQGDRMHAGHGYHAAYGRYRMHHRDDLEGYMRYDREFRARERYDPDFERGYDRGYRPQRADGVHYDDAYLQDFNASSPALHSGRRRGIAPPRSFGRPEEVARGRPTHRTDASRNLRYDQGFGRYVGYNSGGFSEPWVGYDPVARKERSM